jgi:hypothetical protein
MTLALAGVETASKQRTAPRRSRLQQAAQLAPCINVQYRMNIGYFDLTLIK